MGSCRGEGGVGPGGGKGALGRGAARHGRRSPRDPHTALPALSGGGGRLYMAKEREHDMPPFLCYTC